ncbi:CBS domain-containing protein [Actinoplanes sp. NPDC049668]|uniref:CBS domain-containing protein n=1 Tax=unclassified Actinoplanes TaxID=2626549 RepID=UPI0033BF8CB0
MSAPAVVALADTSIAAAARRMDSEGVKRLPVTDDLGRLAGIVSRADLLKVHLPCRACGTGGANGTGERNESLGRTSRATATSTWSRHRRRFPLRTTARGDARSWRRSRPRGPDGPPWAPLGP